MKNRVQKKHANAYLATEAKWRKRERGYHGRWTVNAMFALLVMTGIVGKLEGVSFFSETEPE